MYYLKMCGQTFRVTMRKFCIIGNMITHSAYLLPIVKVNFSNHLSQTVCEILSDSLQLKGRFSQVTYLVKII